jgi:hypothetical protein
MSVNQRKLDALRRGNILVAEIVMSDPERYPPDSLLGIVAKMTLKGGISIRAELEKRAGLRVNSERGDTNED